MLTKVRQNHEYTKGMDKVEIALERMFEAFLSRIPSIVLGVVVLVVGLWLIRVLLRLLRRRFERRNVDLSLRDFLLSVIKISLYILLLLSVASTVGIQTTSFIAVMGAASLSIGLALQGSLSNFAGGVLILLFKPFRIGDYVETAAGGTGVVEKIDILYTTMRTDDGIAVFAPNGPLANTVITNYSSITRRRIVYRVQLSAEADVDQARQLISEVLISDYRMLNTPRPEVRIEEMTETVTKLVIRVWTPKETYVEAYYDNFEQIKAALDKNGVKVLAAS